MPRSAPTSGKKVLSLEDLATMPWVDDQVEKLMESAYGPAHFKKIKAALSTPPSNTCMRINPIRQPDPSMSMNMVVTHLEGFYRKMRELGREPPPPFFHPLLPNNNCIIIPSAPSPAPGHFIDMADQGLKVVVVDRICGEAVLRGADVYAKGVLAASKGLEEGMEVVIMADLDKQVLRGSHWRDFKGRCVRIAKGRTHLARVELFRAHSGLAVEVRERVSSEAPSLNSFLPGTAYLQNLPSLIVAHVMDLYPGAISIDLCSAPGGKASAMAEIQKNQGLVVACDRSHKKVLKIKSLAEVMGLSCIVPLVLDSTKACRPPGPGVSPTAVLDSLPTHKVSGIKLSCGGKDGLFYPETFDRVLLDPPCSAMGLRPKLLIDITLKDLQDHEKYTRGLFHSAVLLLKPGGTLTYSTCTINPRENEQIVKWALDTYPCLDLVPARPPHLGEQGLDGYGLTSEEREKLQRFDPSSQEVDTNGFFISKFTKKTSVLLSV